MVHIPKNETQSKDTIQIERISSLFERPNPRSFTIPNSFDIFNINAVADLGASVNIMSTSIFEELSLAELRNTNMIVEMADKTRCIPQGIIENILVKIDKFSFNSEFVIMDIKGSNNKTIILGQPFLATIHTEIDVSTTEVSLGIKEDGIKIKMNKQDCNFTTSISETLSNKHLKEGSTSHEIQADIYIDLCEPCIQDNQLQDKLKCRAYNTISKTHWCEPVRQKHERGYTFWASCDPYHEICDGGGIPNNKMKHYWKSTNDDDRVDLEWEGLSCASWVRVRYGNINDITKERILQKYWDSKLGRQTREKIMTEDREDNEKYRETKIRAIIGAMVNKLPKEWFSGVSKDKDDLEGIIDYLEPTLYNGFIDPDDEACKQRRNKLLGMPYTEPPLILKEEAEIIRYNLGAKEVFTKTKFLNIKEFPKTAPNIIDIRAEIINSSSEDLSNTKRRHWCKLISQWKKDMCTKWASCNPYFDERDGGNNSRENKKY
ncbi:RNA-directed DNA polymerase, eukaryota, reverse transcriptase zinc-binding domain protein [Tanacetum coccineum]|uniref:RNA-directed DNA polymerase, eukaryota, reverse transcriptase zinc-binding domain protein n=1 Tax=Tanacetum coccineum TaxID=301880 RepID=A0ABQ5BZ91_9ASTR